MTEGAPQPDDDRGPLPRPRGDPRGLDTMRSAVPPCCCQALISYPPLALLQGLTGSDSDDGPEEETKRGKGMSGRFSGSGRGLLQSASERASAQADVEPVCLETLGAASALMQLSSCEPEQHRAAPPSSGSPTRSTGAGGGGGGGGGGGSGAHPPPSVNGMQVPQDAQSMFAALAAAPVAANYPGGVPASGMLPSLRFVLDGINSQSVLQQQQHQALAQHLVAAHQQQLLIQQQQRQQQHMQARSAVGVDSLGSAEQKGAGVLAGGTTEGADGGGDEAKHNKYCHFCQHVKVKRATSMLACVNQECARRFCEHCLVTHLNDSVPKQHEAGSWVCPICRKTCCCAFKTCERNHRHCKAFRYRQRRAEQAAKRSLNAAGGGAARPGNVAAGPVSPSKDAEGGGSPEAAAE
jgi:hypothetical protein